MFLKNGSSVLGGPEFGMLGQAAAQMAHYYDLPCAIASGVSDSKVTDVQAAYETVINFMLVAMARPPVIYGMGSVEGGLTFDFAKLVLDCEHARHLLMAIDGIPVDEYHLAYKEISEVGPRGTYLLQQQTFENMKKQSDVSIFDRNPREIWQDRGEPQALDVAYQKAIKIIQTHKAAALPDGAEEEIDQLIQSHQNRRVRM
jgi:trimethylamine--corrinoid protein Co-methyltransferase